MKKQDSQAKFHCVCVGSCDGRDEDIPLRAQRKRLAFAKCGHRTTGQYDRVSNVLSISVQRRESTEPNVRDPYVSLA